MLIPTFLIQIFAFMIETPNFQDIILINSNNSTYNNKLIHSDLTSKGFQIATVSLYSRDLSKFLYEPAKKLLPSHIICLEISDKYKNYQTETTRTTPVTIENHGPYFHILEGIVSSKNTIKNPWIYLIACDNNNFEPFNNDMTEFEAFIHANIPNSNQTYQINSNLYLVSCTSMYEIYFIKQILFYKQVIKLDYSSKHKSSELYSISTVLRRRDFGLIEIIGAHARSWNFSSTSSMATVAKGITLSYLLLAYMQDFLNFSVRINGNPNWDSMATQVKHGEADYGLSATGMMGSAVKDFRFLTVPTYTDNAIAYYKKLTAEESPLIRPNVPLFLHLQPLSSQAWFLVLGILGGLLVTHFIINNNNNNMDDRCNSDNAEENPKCHHPPPPRPRTSRIHKFLGSAWIIISALTVRSIYNAFEPRICNSLRIVSFIASAFGLLLYALYSGQLISSLSIIRPIEYNLQALMNDGYSFGIIHNSYLRAAKDAADSRDRDSNVNNTDSIGTKLFSRLHSTYGQVENVPSGLETVFKVTKYAFITEEADIYVQIGLNKNLSKMIATQTGGGSLCEFFHDIPIPEFTVQQSPIILRHSPLVNHMNLARARVYETGVWDLFQQRRNTFMNNFKPKCSPPANKTFELADVLLPIFILIGGFSLTWACFLIECLCKTICRVKSIELIIAY